MDLNVDPHQAVSEPAGSLEPPDLRATGFRVDDGRPRVGPGRPQDSFWGECECPDDCPRDHGNE